MNVKLQFLFVLFAGRWFCDAEEIQCSKYHYEEKLLERMYKVQFDAEKFDIKLKEMKNENEKFKEVTARVVEEVSNLGQSYEAPSKQLINEVEVLKKSIHTLEKRLAGKRSIRSCTSISMIT